MLNKDPIHESCQTIHNHLRYFKHQRTEYYHRDEMASHQCSCGYETGDTSHFNRHLHTCGLGTHGGPREHSGGPREHSGGPREHSGGPRELSGRKKKVDEDDPPDLRDLKAFYKALDEMVDLRVCVPFAEKSAARIVSRQSKLTTPRTIFLIPWIPVLASGHLSWLTKTVTGPCLSATAAVQNFVNTGGQSGQYNFRSPIVACCSSRTSNSASYAPSCLSYQFFVYQEKAKVQPQEAA